MHWLEKSRKEKYLESALMDWPVTWITKNSHPDQAVDIRQRFFVFVFILLNIKAS